MKTLGLSLFHRNASAALLDQGGIVAAAQQERFSRVKDDAGFPYQAIEFCLGAARCGLNEVENISVYGASSARLAELIRPYLNGDARGFLPFRAAVNEWAKDKFLHRTEVQQKLARFSSSPGALGPKITFCDRQLSQAAAAFYLSPFEDAVILNLGESGKDAQTSVALGRGTQLQVVERLPAGHTIGTLFDAFHDYLGLASASLQQEFSALAAAGEPVWRDKIKSHLLDIKADGSFRLNLSYFTTYGSELRSFNGRFVKLWGQPARKPDDKLTNWHKDLAASVQAVFTDIIALLMDNLASRYNLDHLCLTGDIVRQAWATQAGFAAAGPFKKIWLQPVAANPSGAIGSALIVQHLIHHQPRPRAADEHDGLHGTFLGPRYGNRTVRKVLEDRGAKFEMLSDEALIEASAHAIAEGKVLAWFQGRAEYGNASLGSRSVLVDQRALQASTTGFAPFNTSVLYEKAQQPSQLANEQFLRPIEAVRCEINPRFHKLLEVFAQHTGHPALAKADFRKGAEPIVSSPEDAFRCFMDTEIDALAIGNCFLRKEDQQGSAELQG